MLNNGKFVRMHRNQIIYDWFYSMANSLFNKHTFNVKSKYINGAYPMEQYKICDVEFYLCDSPMSKEMR